MFGNKSQCDAPHVHLVYILSSPKMIFQKKGKTDKIKQQQQQKLLIGLPVCSPILFRNLEFITYCLVK